MASKEQIQLKIDLYDSQVTAAQSEYNFKRDQSIADGFAVVVAGKKTIDEVDAELQDLAKVTHQLMTDRASARMPLLREICADIDTFVGKVPEDFVAIRQTAQVILLAESVSSVLDKSVN